MKKSMNGLQEKVREMVLYAHEFYNELSAQEVSVSGSDTDVESGDMIEAFLQALPHALCGGVVWYGKAGEA